MQITDIVILAGGRADKLDPEAAFKGMVMVAGRTLLEHTLMNLFAMDRFKKIVLTVPRPVASVLGESDGRLKEMLSDPRIIEVVTDRGVIDNLVAGVKAASGEFVMVATVDIPFLTERSVEKLAEDASRIDADFFYPIITETSVQEQYPDLRKTFAQTREGRFAGGNLFITKRSVPLDGHDVLSGLFELRKSPVKLVRRLGIFFLIKFALKALTIRDVENKISELMHSRGRAVVVQPDIGMDLDREDDIAKFEECLKVKLQVEGE